MQLFVQKGSSISASGVPKVVSSAVLYSHMDWPHPCVTPALAIIWTTAWYWTQSFSSAVQPLTPWYPVKLYAVQFGTALGPDEMPIALSALAGIADVIGGRTISTATSAAATAPLSAATGPGGRVGREATVRLDRWTEAIHLVSVRRPHHCAAVTTATPKSHPDASHAPRNQNGRMRSFHRDHCGSKRKARPARTVRVVSQMPNLERFSHATTSAAIATLSITRSAWG